MDKIDLTVLSREGAEAYIPDQPTAYISIYTPGCDPATFRQHTNILDVLSLCFDDLSDDRFQGLALGSDGRICRLITDDHAAEIKIFVQKHRAMGVSHFLVHCDAGISRSPGVAVALDQVFNGAREIRHGWGCYNRLVERRVREAFTGPVVAGKQGEKLCQD